MQPAYYNFSKHVSGDTFFGAQFEIFDKDKVPVDLTSCIVKMQLRRTAGNEMLVEWSSQTGGIIITTNKIDIQQKKVSIPEFDYRYDLQVIYPDQSIITLVAGLFPVINDITR